MAGRKSKYSAALQQEIVDNLTLGVTVEKTCALVGISQETYFQYVKRLPEFSEAVTRAQASIHRAAVGAVRIHLASTEQLITETNTVEETRLRWVKTKDGGEEQQPYIYRHTIHTTKVIKSPPDWRAGIEYLKRRDRDNWSDKTLIEHDWRKEAAAQGIDPARLFEEMVSAASKLLPARLGSTDERSVDGGEEAAGE